MNPDLNKKWDEFEERFYASATREDLIESLRQISSYNRYLLRISGLILADHIDREKEKANAA